MNNKEKQIENNGITNDELGTRNNYDEQKPLQSTIRMNDNQ